MLLVLVVLNLNDANPFRCVAAVQEKTVCFDQGARNEYYQRDCVDSNSNAMPQPKEPNSTEKTF